MNRVVVGGRRAVSGYVVSLALSVFAALALMVVFGPRVLDAGKSMLGVEASCGASGLTAQEYVSSIRAVLDEQPSVPYERLPLSLYVEFQGCFPREVESAKFDGFELFAQAELAFRKERWQDAAEMYEKLINDRPFFPWIDVAREQLEDSYLSLKQYDKVVWLQGLEAHRVVLQDYVAGRRKDYIPFPGLGVKQMVRALGGDLLGLQHLDAKYLEDRQLLVVSGDPVIKGHSFELSYSGVTVRDEFVYVGNGVWRRTEIGGKETGSESLSSRDAYQKWLKGVAPEMISSLRLPIRSGQSSSS